MSWRQTRRRRGVRRYLNPVTLGGLLLVVITAAPLYWMAVTSFKTPVEAGASPPTFFPENPTLDNYRRAWGEADMDRYLANSAIVSVSATPLDSWHMFEQSGRLFVPRSRTNSW